MIGEGFGIDFTELTEFNEHMVKSLKNHPKEAKFFMNKMGARMRVLAKREARKLKHKRKEPSKWYITGLKKGKAYVYVPENSYSIRVYAGAEHGHLLEYGHEMFGHKPNKKYVGKFVKPIPIMERANKAFEGEFIRNVDKYIDKLLEKGYAG